MSLVAADTGRLEGQTGKVTVRTGNCQWTETVSVVTKVTRNVKAGSYDPKTIRFVVASVSLEDSGGQLVDFHNSTGRRN